MVAWRIEEDLIDWIKAAAVSRKITQTALVEEILEAALIEVCGECGQPVREKKAPRIPPVVEKPGAAATRIKSPKVIGGWE